MWSNLKTALESDVGISLPDSDSLQADLVGPGYKFNSANVAFRVLTRATQLRSVSVNRTVPRLCGRPISTATYLTNIRGYMSEQPKLHHVTVQIFPPSETSHGQVAEGVYRLEDNEVILVDHFGNPVRDPHGKTYRKKLQPGEDARVIAGRLTKQFRSARRGGRDSKFSAPINYPKTGWM